KKVRSVMDRLLKDDSSAGTVACVLLAGLRIGLDKADLAKFKGDMKDALLQLTRTTDKLGEAVAPADKLPSADLSVEIGPPSCSWQLKSFADSSVQSPVVLFLKSGATLSKSSGSGVVSVQLADVWAVHLGAFVFNIDFMKAKPTVGSLSMTVSAKSSEKQNDSYSLLRLLCKSRVVSTVAVQSMEVAVADRDQQSAPVPVKLTYRPRLKVSWRLILINDCLLSFRSLCLGDNTPVTVHQAFIRLNHLTANKEAIFVAEPIRTSVDLATGGKNLDYLSGLYAMELIVGDALIDKSLVWHLADETERAALKPKPEIKHVFRQPDKMAPASIAMGFTILCLAPLAILLILWAYLGANLSGFVTSVPALLFHIGLAGILILYFFYWSCLNMFETLRYLCLLGVPTFICGNRLLRSLASGGSG
uniref:Dolichyl-diphosphooligosaccharide--protein glycosyltransferase subunit 2 n=1 Tax=Macrostomum lignano TaxID=282301 RepID=A0A1I8FR21_9PLAT